MSLCTTIRQCCCFTFGTEPCAIGLGDVDLERHVGLARRRDRGGELAQHLAPLRETARVAVRSHIGQFELCEMHQSIRNRRGDETNSFRQRLQVPLV